MIKNLHVGKRRLTLKPYVQTPQNGETYSNNSSAKANESFECI